MEDLKKAIRSAARSGELTKFDDVVSFLKDMQSELINEMLEAEMDNHLGYEKNSVSGNNSGNSRNGSYNKKVKSDLGECEITVPRDRNSDFEPVVVEKHSNNASGIEKLVISLYAKGMSVSDIEEELREIYNFKLSQTAISVITNRVMQQSLDWQNRPLDDTYFVIWMDGIVFKVRDNGKVVNKCVYICMGLNKEGIREILGMWIGKNESSSFWMGVLTDLKARGVSNVYITCTDNLNGFTETIKNVFPNAATQICVVHQIRNSCRYVTWKDKKEFTSDLKLIYNATNIEVAKYELDNFSEKWGKLYPYAVKSWNSNWENLTTFFAYTLEIRKIIYTTNIIENFNGKLRKYTNNKLSFSTDEALKKSLYLAICEVQKKWKKPIHNWGLVFNQFITTFETE